jgi:hypothetical protein
MHKATIAAVAATAFILTAGAVQAQERTVESATQFLDLFARDHGFHISRFRSARPGPSEINAARAQAHRATIAAIHDHGGRPGCATAIEDADDVGIDVFWENVVSVEWTEFEPRPYDTRVYHPYVLVKQVRPRTGESHIAFYPERAGDLNRLFEALRYLHQNCSALTATGF